MHTQGEARQKWLRTSGCPIVQEDAGECKGWALGHRKREGRRREECMGLAWSGWAARREGATGAMSSAERGEVSDEKRGPRMRTRFPWMSEGVREDGVLSLREAG